MSRTPCRACQPSASRIRSAAATTRGGSPARRGRTTGSAHAWSAVPVTSRITSTISRTETPSPRPMFAVSAGTPPSAGRGAAATCAEAMSRDVDEVPHAGAVGRGEVVAEDLRRDAGRSAAGTPSGRGSPRRGRPAPVGAARHVEVAQAHVPQAGGRGDLGDHLLADQLRPAVRVHRPAVGVLVDDDRRPARRRRRRSRRRRTSSTPRRRDGLEQDAQALDVLAVVEQRRRTDSSHLLLRRDVHDAADAVLARASAPTRSASSTLPTTSGHALRRVPRRPRTGRRSTTTPSDASSQGGHHVRPRCSPLRRSPATSPADD